jgi:steroid 5-alpha reductase family enzyme
MPAPNLRFLIGVALFFAGMACNIFSDAALHALRDSGDNRQQKQKGVLARGSARYKIPRGGAFEWVSCANYFGEVVEWTGFAVACWSLPALAFAVYTFCNLGPRAHHHHNWYKNKFEDYPSSRKAIIPFVW